MGRLKLFIFFGVVLICGDIFIKLDSVSELIDTVCIVLYFTLLGYRISKIPIRYD